MKKKKIYTKKQKSSTPSLYDSDVCWQCEFISSPELGIDMLPESGGYCSCKGWTDDIYVEACELFRKKSSHKQNYDVDPIIKQDWDNINKM